MRTSSSKKPWLSSTGGSSDGWCGERSGLRVMGLIALEPYDDGAFCSLGGILVVGWFEGEVARTNGCENVVA